MISTFPNHCLEVRYCIANNCNSVLCLENFPLGSFSSLDGNPDFRASVGHRRCAFRWKLGLLFHVDSVANLYERWVIGAFHFHFGTTFPRSLTSEWNEQRWVNVETCRYLEFPTGEKWTFLCAALFCNGSSSSSHGLFGWLFPNERDFDDHAGIWHYKHFININIFL